VDGARRPLPQAVLRAREPPDTVGQEKVAAQLVEALEHFRIQARVIGMVSGPHITRYELRLAPGIKVGAVAKLKDDLAYALAAADIRILAPIPGKQAVGVEVPNVRRQTVHLGDVMQQPPEDWSPLTVWLGKDVAGRAIGCDLAKMPHLLVAGTTGAGKSGCVNAMLSSILLRATPHQVRLVLVDPKQVELNHYESIPHLLTPVITNPKKAAVALQNLVREMEQRYTYMSLARTRSLTEMNRVREGRGEPALPYVLCVIDELADLMMVAPADVEDSIIRLAQKARAVGIHLVLATQSPRVDVITGMIKANVPSRIAFAVSSQTDSRVILDQNGAETLLGMGDMLFAPVGSSRLQRIQGAYIDEPRSRSSRKPGGCRASPSSTRSCSRRSRPKRRWPTRARTPKFDPDEDPLLEDAIRLVAEMQTASTSMLQRRLRLGYTRAGALDRHARAPRGHLGLRGIQAAPGARLRSGPSRHAPGVVRTRGGSARGRRRAAGRRVALPRLHARDRHHTPRRAQPPQDRPMQVETDTKIRTKYLRALENEEWDLLPGPTYVKTFLRTYAEYLGLDAKLLVEEYKQRYERPTPQELTPFSTNLGSRRERRRARGPLISPGVIAGICFVALIGLLAGIGLLWNDPGGRAVRQAARAKPDPTPTASERASERRARARARERRRRAAAASRTVSLQILPEATVNVCLVSRTGRPLIRSQNLAQGQASRRFTGRRFRVTFGNGLVRMRVGRRSYAVPDSDSAIGYEIRPGRGPRRLPPARQPTCA
jgi:hypothetical protein